MKNKLSAKQKPRNEKIFYVLQLGKTKGVFLDCGNQLDRAVFGQL